MKLNKIEKKIKTTESECEVTEITLLSEKEYKKYKHLIPLIRNWWWLRSPRYVANGVVIVGVNYDCTCDSISYDDNTNSYYGVRPALWIVPEVPEFLKPGNKIELNDITWTVLDYANGKFYVLADKIIGCHRFDGKRNIWKQSELKKWLEEWKESWTE